MPGRFAANALLLAWLAICSTSWAGEQPNVVLVLIDDLGWSDVGCYGNDFVETPRIDQLAREGVRFTDAYASGTVCSPTRCAIQTGQNPARVGMTDFIPGHWRPFERVWTPRPTPALPGDIVTVAESLGAAGYTTGYFGKWHLGNGPQFQPQHHGYDDAVVINGPHLPGRYRVAGQPGVQPKPDQYRTEFEADLAVDFIQRHRDAPFFLTVSPFAVHIPLAAMSPKVEKYRRKAMPQNSSLPHPVYAAMIEHCDDLVGRIVDAIDDCNLAEQTMIVFTSDNGGLYRRYDYREQSDDTVSDLAPLKGQKGTVYEGGIRVPLIVKYPASAQAGGVCAEPVISHDLFPTLVDLAGGELPVNQSADGRSFLPLLSAPDQTLDREALYWHYPHYHHHRPASAVRRGEWKYIEYLDGTTDHELFNLANDLGEADNLAEQRPRLASALQRRLQRWRQEILAAMPVPNPHFDPQRAEQWWNVRSGEPVDSDRRARFPATEKELATN